ncbi:doublecortin domain-containing protein 1-like isoform X3 [Dendronephthya gigantea]|uniref:doublecortin domain-containing protein 1-like isoform X3 n=1 Tax=Dendronephthya gigantea TaxID=151771 RepID=UPI00106C8BC8|nr:doublecortin domain-containing protein 1-like isoform X3 [Dendronephthya gigantea]
MSSMRRGESQDLEHGFSDSISDEDAFVLHINAKETHENESQKTKHLANNKKRFKRPKSSNGALLVTPATSQRNMAWSSASEQELIKNPAFRFKPKLSRPVSAPNCTSGKRSSVASTCSSVCSSSLELSRPMRMRRHVPLYKKSNTPVSVRAFVNGEQDTFARVTAPNLKQLLELCTTKLHLVSAARKAFLSDGTLIRDIHQIMKNADIYVSCGEPFKDPFEKEKLSQMSTWTMNGIIFPESETRGKTKPSLSQRMKKVLVENQKKRVLVFRNEDSLEGKEIIANRFDEFLDDCTQKLGFQSRAKAIFDWDGKEIVNFSQVPTVDNILQSSSITVLGPVWLTRGGEKFSFKGPYGFVDTLLETTKQRLKETKSYEKQLQLRVDNIIEGVSVEVMSLTEEETKNEMSQITKKVHDLETVIPKLKSRKKRLFMKKEEEGMVGANHSSYKFQNITEIEENSRLLGKKGIRLKVYENGKVDDEVVVYFNIHEASKGASDDRNVLLRRLIDTITAQVLRKSHGPAGRSLARRIYKDDGKEVLDVHELETDDCIWLSFGEKFISPYTYALQLTMDKTKCVSLWNEKKVVQRETINEDEVYGKDRASLWRTVENYPTDCKYDVIELDMEIPGKVGYAKGLQYSQIRENNTFLRYKGNTDLILLPDLSVEKKLSKVDNSMWPSDSQQWVIHKSGHITSRSFPQLCLCMSHIKVNVKYSDGTSLEGFAVNFAKRNSSHPSQIWKFTPTGDICSASNPSFLLTWMSNENHQIVDEDDKHPGLSGEVEKSCAEENNETIVVETLSTMKDIFGGEKCCVALLSKLPVKHPAIGTQRWAIKQESLNSIGQWKFSQVANPTWNRKALSWPVNKDGTINEEFNWPMEGFLICNAPPLKRKETLSVGPPVRLRVLKNGEHDLKRAVIVVGPDLGNMTRDISGKSTAMKPSKTKKHSPLPSSRNDIRNLELNLFLDRCTDSLRLPFAARRLFNDDGKELFTLSGLERNQLVFVSCGESWVNYNDSYSDQKRRIIMSNLSSDIAKLRLYCRLRNPQGLVLTVGGTATAGSPVCVASCDLIENENDIILSDQEIHHSQSENSIEGVRSSLMSAHERAHVNSEERLKSLQWPWETAITSNGEVNVEAEQYGDFEHDVVYSDNRLHKRYRYHTAKSESKKELLSCQWLYKDGWIQLRNNNQLVLGIGQDSTEGKLINEVCLCKKRMDDVNQRWTIASDGTIHLHHNPNATLTVSDPGRARENSGDSAYDGSHVLIMPRRCCNGNANQLWMYDTHSGFISAFATDSMNLEITSANKAGICTYTVLGSKSTMQSGYSIQNDSSKGFLCDACGVASRGKFILQKLEQSQDFSCVMGKEGSFKSTKQDKSSCFKCLTNQVDLTSQEANATLAMWEDQLKRLRKIKNFRSLNKEIQAAQSQPAVRIRAFKNGEGIRKEAVLVVGSTIDSLLDQCTCRLGQTSAARRLYNIDGELITDISQLREDSGTKENILPREVEKYAQREQMDKQTEDPVDVVCTANDCSVIEEHQMPKKTQEDGGGKYCVDVFVSCGEPFVPLEEIDMQFFLQMKHQYARNWVENHLETEKHILRQIQGRRIAARSSIESRSWHNLTKQEEDKQDNIEELTGHLKDLKTKQQQEKELLISNNAMHCRLSNNKRLYDSSKTVRIDVYENGDAERRYINVCGSTLNEVLNICTSRLGLPAAARRLFTTGGDEIEDASELVKGEIYCVSCGENFIQPRDRQTVIARKATWSRLNRQTGGAMAFKSDERTPVTTLALQTSAQDRFN